MGQEENRAQYNPFSVSSGPKNAVSIILGFFIMVFGFLLPEENSTFSKTDQMHLLSGLFTLALLTGILLQFPKHPHLWEVVVSPPEKNNR